MNLLVDAPPESVEVGGVRYRVNAGFRVFVLFEMLMQDPSVLWPDKIALALSYFYRDDPPPDTDAAIERLLWFYRCGEAAAPGGDASDANRGPAYSFSRDGGAIVAAFRETYQIDLTAEEMHWWVFRALFDRLLSGVGFGEIVRCRVADTRGMPRQQAAYFRAMKRAYGLGRAPSPAQALSCAARDKRLIEYVARRYRETGNA